MGAFGFFYQGSDEAPGNMGLYDQVLNEINSYQFFYCFDFRQICEMFCLSSQILITNQTKLAETLNEPQPCSAVDLLMSYFVPIINQHDLLDYYGNVPKNKMEI